MIVARRGASSRSVGIAIDAGAPDNKASGAPAVPNSENASRTNRDDIGQLFDIADEGKTTGRPAWPAGHGTRSRRATLGRLRRQANPTMRVGRGPVRRTKPFSGRPPGADRTQSRVTVTAPSEANPGPRAALPGRRAKPKCKICADRSGFGRPQGLDRRVVATERGRSAVEFTAPTEPNPGSGAPTEPKPAMRRAKPIGNGRSRRPNPIRPGKKAEESLRRPKPIGPKA